ncbi:MAG TPA: acetyl-CoA carboxylase biotin carboxylase subunit [Verrucomicrobiae bacterium]|jgi:acetyl-CoA carboxylase biotin carboxylase subunit|nr:acetyl-CoA carboxylase biotin carboxylase subunit [Verrucomicrobiae bacterium]
MFRKILIANRGEIAVRIARACREMGILSAAVFSDADRAALHVRLADEAYRAGPAPSRESYLRIDKLMEIARGAGCDALHPGYGFLAENPKLPRACAENQITFIGPSPESMERLGSKTAARQLAARVGVPMVPGTQSAVEILDDAEGVARAMGYPVLLKAVAGGGGKGMRLVGAESEMAAAWRDASSEALNSFGDARLYLEKYVERPRHIEIQIFGDAHGNLVYLGERECSVQRRHQKVIEESPSPIMTPDLQRAMGEAAVRLAREAGYTNAGTVEFLVDSERKFYFLEVNTRLQVEHPVTEMVTGLDLVKLQIRVAASEPLPFAQDDVRLSGHAVECRLYAEDPANQFFPSPGKILSRRLPSGPGIRLDDGVYDGFTVSTEYDPMLAKLIAWGENRAEAIARLRRGLEEYSATGIKTNASLLLAILRDSEFLRGDIYARWLDERLPDFLGRSNIHETDSVAEDAAILAALLHTFGGNREVTANGSRAETESRWKRAVRFDQVDRSE